MEVRIASLRAIGALDLNFESGKKEALRLKGEVEARLFDEAVQVRWVAVEAMCAMHIPVPEGEDTDPYTDPYI